jgi:hypothetical protein
LPCLSDKISFPYYFLMDRIALIRELMTKKNLINYLEIGVFNGRVFFRVKSTFKIAVDPSFAFDRLRRFGKILVNPYNLFNHYIEKKSDDFFAADAPRLFADRKCNMSLIDGMHEYHFALRDVENTLKYLSEDGIIIMHDCNPVTKEEACSFEEWKAKGFKGQWNGDVWKTIMHLRTFRDDINVFVLDCDQGLGVITRRTPETRLTFSRDDIHRFSYEDFNKNRSLWLNLKPAPYYKEYFNL